MERVQAGEVITYTQLKELLDCSDESEVLKKTRLKCINCGFLGTVTGMRVEVDMNSPTDWQDDDENNDSGSTDFGDENPFKPNEPYVKPQLTTPKWKTTVDGCEDYVEQAQEAFSKCVTEELGNKNKAEGINHALISLKQYKSNFECPKCGSTAVTIPKGEIERLTTEVL